ncbi:MAG: tetratricopeptide repeat protein [Saprospiraceae bacterium]
MAQTNFREGWEKANPIEKGSSLSFAEKIAAHTGLLEKAIKDRDELQKLYAYLYLTSDHLNVQDYAAAAESLLQAEAIAIAANNPGWQGWVNYRKGNLSVRMRDYESALPFYEKAVPLCSEAKDSLCIAECLEQIGIVHGMLDDFEKAEEIHLKAITLLEKFGGEDQMASALNNFGVINSLKKRYKEAIPYFERSIELDQILDKPRDKSKAMNNLADIYRKLKQYDVAIQKFEECERFNKANNFLENMVQNYVGLGLTYEAMGNYEAALRSFEKHEMLKDSLIGAETQRKIAELEIKYETQQKELELEKSKLALEASQRRVERRTAMIFFILLLAAVGLWRWRLQTRQAKLELQKNQENLKNLTHLLLEKNKQLMTISERLEKKLATTIPDNLGVNIFDQTILTDEDWTSFKMHFEKAYPGYMFRLRNAFPSLTEAEERLFLFIKLNLTTKESASLLGISPDSVKKTRNRLRKRLDLDENTELDAFVQSF